MAQLTKSSTGERTRP